MSDWGTASTPPNLTTVTGPLYVLVFAFIILSESCPFFKPTYSATISMTYRNYVSRENGVSNSALGYQKGSMEETEKKKKARKVTPAGEEAQVRGKTLFLTSS